MHWNPAGEWFRKLLLSSRGEGEDEERENEEREKWRALFSGIKLRLLTAPPKVDVYGLEFGELRLVGVSLDPEEVADQIWRESDVCPICGEKTTPADAIAASLQPEFNSGLSYLMGVWIHRACFEKCPESDEERGVPW